MVRVTKFQNVTINGTKYTGSPVTGVITDRFGTHSAWRKSQGLGPHSGVDIAAPEGTPITSPAAGKFVWSGWTDGGLGFITIIDHGDVGTLYAHQPQAFLLFRNGDRVAAGDRIGTVGNTGTSSGPHVHWMASSKARSGQWDFTRSGGGLLDPLSLVVAVVTPAKLSPPLDGEHPTGYVWNGVFDAVMGGTEGTYEPLPQQKTGWGEYIFRIKLP